jgi:alpha-L-fucosidase 2
MPVVTCEISEETCGLQEVDMRQTGTLTLKAPARGFIDSFLLGNGWLGAAVRGAPGIEHIDLNADTLWSGGPAPAVGRPAPQGLIDSVRTAVARRDFLAADRLARELQGGRFGQSYQPAGWLRWRYASEHAIAYERTLDLRDAIACVRFTAPDGEVQVQSFCSAPAGVLVARASGAVNAAALEYGSEHPGMRAQREHDVARDWLTVTGRAPAHVDPNYVSGGGEHIRYGTEPPDAGGLVDAGMGFAVVTVVERVDERTVRLIASVETGYRGPGRRPSADLDALAAAARQRIERALSQTTDDLERAHINDHHALYDRARLVLEAGDDAEQSMRLDRHVRYFNFGRYLLIASSRRGTQPANLQGIWNVDVRPAWCCSYTTNINLEMNYWPADRVGLGELAEPLREFVGELAEQGREIAVGHYGARGCAAHHNSDIWRFAAPVPGLPQWSNWPSALFWLSDQLDQSDAYQARPATPPPWRGELVDFALDLLVPDTDGDLVVSPSTSPEHFFVVDAESTAAVSSGSAMDQELVAATLRTYLASRDSEPCAAAEAESIDRARRALQRIRNPRVGRDGALLEWSDERVPGESGHRHLSHLYGLFPGDRITESGTPDDFAAAREALRLRLAGGSGYTGWSQAWVLCLAARLRDALLAQQSLDILTTELCSASLLDLHPADDQPDGYVFQIDGNLGAVAGVAELLVQSHEGLIALLKTLPPAWQSGHFRGLRARGGHTIDAQWHEGVITAAELAIGRERAVIIDVPAASAGAVVDELGHQVRITETASPWGAGRRRLSWSAEAGHRYTVAW